MQSIAAFLTRRELARGWDNAVVQSASATAAPVARTVRVVKSRPGARAAGKVMAQTLPRPLLLAP